MAINNKKGLVGEKIIFCLEGISRTPRWGNLFLFLQQCISSQQS